MSDLPTISQVIESHNAATGEVVAPEPVTKTVVAEETPPAAVAAPEPQAEAPKPATPVRDPASAKFGALARKEAETRRNVAAAEARAKEIEVREKALAEREARLTAAKRNPIDLLKEHGYSYADATEAVMGNYKAPEETPADPYAERFDRFEAHSSELKKELDQVRAALAAKEQAEAIGQVMKNIGDTLADKDRYELINAVGSEGVDMVRDVMVEHWNKHQEMLDYSKAADIVEAYYDETYVNRLAGTKKFQSRLPKPEPKPVARPVAAPKEPKERVSLSNDMAAGGAAITDVDKMTRDEFIAHAAKKLQYK